MYHATYMIKRRLQKMEQNKEEIVQEELKPNPEYILEVKI